MVADGACDSIRMRSIAPADHRRRGPVVGRQFDRRRPGSDGPPWSIVALGWPHCRPRPRKIDSSYNAQENFRWYRDAATRLGYIMDCSHALTAANGLTEITPFAFILPCTTLSSGNSAAADRSLFRYITFWKLLHLLLNIAINMTYKKIKENKLN